MKRSLVINDFAPELNFLVYKEIFIFFFYQCSSCLFLAPDAQKTFPLIPSFRSLSICLYSALCTHAQCSIAVVRYAHKPCSLAGGQIGACALLRR